MTEMVLGYFEMGYAVYFGSYYGEGLYETVEEIRECLEEIEDDDWLYVESVTVDDDAREVRVFIGDDE